MASVSRGSAVGWRRTFPSRTPAEPASLPSRLIHQAATPPSRSSLAVDDLHGGSFRPAGGVVKALDARGQTTLRVRDRRSAIGRDEPRQGPSGQARQGPFQALTERIHHGLDGFQSPLAGLLPGEARLQAHLGLAGLGGAGSLPLGLAKNGGLQQLQPGLAGGPVLALGQQLPAGLAGGAKLGHHAVGDGLRRRASRAGGGNGEGRGQAQRGPGQPLFLLRA